jgi:hypothetical protein
MKIKDGFVLEEVGGSYLAVAVGERADSFNGLVRLNGTGAFLWNLMKDADVSREQLVDEIMKVYEGVSREQATADIIAFEAKLKNGGILE